MAERSIAGYRLLDRLADGGSSHCWRAEDPQGRIYILKQFFPRDLAPHLEELPNGAVRLNTDHPLLRRRFLSAISMFRREAAAAREIRALYSEQSGNDYFYAASLGELDHQTEGELRYGAFLLYDTTGGETLTALLNRRELHLDAEQGVLTALAWTRRIVEAVAQMHGHKNAAGQEAPWLHLDLRPSNLYCTRMELDHDEGQRVFRLLDLGSAYPLGAGPEETALRQSTLLSSTEEYAAPEVLRLMYDPEADVTLTRAADVYAIGAILFRMLSGHVYDCHDLPPDSPAVAAIPLSARHVLTEEVLRPILNVDPEQRPSLAELSAVLSRLQKIILHKGVCREVLFTSARRFADTLREQPETALLPQWTFEGQLFSTLAQLLAQVSGQHLFLAGSGMQGKTFSLLHAMVTLTRSPEGPVPLYVPLAAFRDAGDKTHFLRDYLLSRYAGERDMDDPAAALELGFKTGAFLLLADGLNEAVGDPNFSLLIAELRRFSGYPGLRVVISAQSDMRRTNFPDCGFSLAKPAPLSQEQVSAYLTAHDLAYPTDNAGLRQTLQFPMLLKMYACSAPSATAPGTPQDRRFSFYANPRSAAEIVVNYREHVLTKLYDPRDPDAFPITALLVREFLPYLAFHLCSDEHWYSFSSKMLQSELNRFFHDLQQPAGVELLGEYGYPDLTFGQPDTVKLDGNFDLLLAVDNHLLSNQLSSNLQQTIQILQDAGVEEAEQEVQRLLGPTLFLHAPLSGVVPSLAASGRRANAVGKLLAASGLLLQDEDQNWRFAHDSLRSIFCADYLARFALRCRGPADLKLHLGRYPLPRPICRHLGALCGTQTLRRTLSLLRDHFDPINAHSLSDYRYEGMALSAENWETSDFVFLHLLLGLSFLLPDSKPLSAAELDAFLEKGDDVSLPDPNFSLEQLNISYLSSSLATRRLSLLDPERKDAATFVHCFAEVAGSSFGSYALAAANLVEALLQTTGSLAGEDLSRLDLSSARLRGASLSDGATGAVLDGSFLYCDQLRGFDFFDHSLRQPVFLQHNYSGRFLYLSYGKRLRCFDLWSEQEIEGFAGDWEPSAPISRFWLSDDQPLLTVVLEDDSVWLLDAYSGEPQDVLSPRMDAPDGGNVRYACGLGDTLYVQMARNGILLLYELVPEEPPRLREVLERRQLSIKDDLMSGLLHRPGFVLRRDRQGLRFFECGESGTQPFPVGTPLHTQFAAAYSPDGRQLTIFGSNGIEVQDTATGEQVHLLPSRHRQTSYRFDADGSLRAYGINEVRSLPDGRLIPGASTISPIAQSAGSGLFLTRPGKAPFTGLRDGSSILPAPQSTVCAFLAGETRYLLTDISGTLALYVQTAQGIELLQRVSPLPKPNNLQAVLDQTRQTVQDRIFPPRYSLCRLGDAFYYSRATNTETAVFSVASPEHPLFSLEGKHNAVRLYPLDDVLLLSTSAFTLELAPADGTLLARYDGFFISDLVDHSVLFTGRGPDFVSFRQRHPNSRTFLRPPLEREFLDLYGVSLQNIQPEPSPQLQKTLRAFGAAFHKEEP